MKITRRITLLGALAAILSGCASKFRAYDGPEVTQVAVFKNSRRLYLFNRGTELRAYDIDLGFAPIGDKKVSGDGKTPEGDYVIDRRNPDSRFHLSIGIDYPNEKDIADAKTLGEDPGGDIFIHGLGTMISRRKPDWTWGCISVTNNEIEEIYAMVNDGTPISIYK